MQWNILTKFSEIIAQKQSVTSMKYGGYSLSSLVEAPPISREVLPKTYFLLVVMAADAQT
jgi:hypothetical protein